MAAIVEKDQQFLLVEENVEGDVVLNQPAGHLEPGESLLDAVRRESLEETGWQVEPQHLTGIHRWVHDNGDTYLRFNFAARAIHEVPGATLDHGINRAIWMSLQEIEQATNLRSPLVIESINSYLKGNKLPLEIIKDIS